MSDIAFEVVEVRTAPDLAFAAPGFMRAYLWEMNEAPKWDGRNWRRIKRERRKWMRAAAHR